MHCQTCGSIQSLESKSTTGHKSTPRKFLNLNSDLESAGDQTDLEIAYLQHTTSAIEQENVPYIEEKIDHKRICYPFCIVFIPFPILSWAFPVVGHIGIGMSDGVIRDFSQNYEIGINTLSYGRPTKYCKLNPQLASNIPWDDAIGLATHKYLRLRDKPVSSKSRRSFVAESLNLMGYKNYKRWNRINLLMMMIRHGRYTDCKGFLRTWLPFCLLVFICILLFSLIQAYSNED